MANESVSDLLKGMKQRQVISSNLAVLNRQVQKYDLKRKLIGQQKVLPTVSSFITPPLNNMKVNKQLCPVRIEAEHLKLRDILLLDPFISEQVAAQICARLIQDYGTPASELSALVESVHSQLKEYREFLDRWEAAREALPTPLPNLVIKLDLLFGVPPLQVIDQLEWSLSDTGDEQINVFAVKYTRELGLPNEAVLAVTFSIREQLYLARRALLAAGLDPTNDESLQALLTNSSSIQRANNVRDSFTPLVEHLNEVALDRAEQSHERALRRRKRTQQQASKRRRGDAWSITGSPPRVYCTPLGTRLDATSMLGSEEEGSNAEEPQHGKRKRATRRK